MCDFVSYCMTLKNLVPSKTPVLYLPKIGFGLSKPSITPFTDFTPNRPQSLIAILSFTKVYSNSIL
jgi:hypothetical protein